VNKCFFGDCRDTMRKLIADGMRVQMCVTSQPYYGLRDYGHPGQLGLEETPAEYVAAMVEVFDLVRDLLADDGVLWLNLGDSYAGTGKSGGGAQGKRWETCGMDTEGPRGGKWMPPPPGMRAKNLLGIPWRVALALQEDGWNLRQDIIWHKPNPMPESVTDRCTKAHEYLFLLSKSERYYYDHEAIKEPDKGTDHKRNVVTPIDRTQPGVTPHMGLRCDAGRNGLGRNKRSVWTVPTKPYSGAHFATFPPALIEPCILAGSRPGDIVFDPFFGSGTTGQVSQAFGRQWIGCEINESNLALQDARTVQAGLCL
jgi:DNA modification methylase